MGPEEQLVQVVVPHEDEWSVKGKRAWCPSEATEDAPATARHTAVLHAPQAVLQLYSFFGTMQSGWLQFRISL
jgi:hypothetical protein